ncbi:MAG: hypothetical protein JNK43_06795 [Ignavibacteria bacterium]|nr:hypothetical protein [Ignavibacteria bacterium]
MKIRILVPAVLLAVSLFSFTNAQQLKDHSSGKLTLKSRGDGQSLMIEDKISVSKQQNGPIAVQKLTPGELNTESKFRDAEYNLGAKKKKKSIGLGLLFSALLPGAGELYGENYLRAGIFFGIELLAWGTYFYFQGKGNSQTDDFQAYADQYWDVRTYARWLKDQQFPSSGGINPDEPNRDILREQIMVCERVNFSHTMPEYGSQQYYELIGKYQNFQAGWTNLSHVPTRDPGPYNYQTYKDPVFIDYANERQKANDFYDYAKIGPITAVINHVLSALDAAWVVSAYNNQLKMETGFRIQNKVSPYTYQYKQVPTFNLSVSF